MAIPSRQLQHLLKFVVKKQYMYSETRQLEEEMQLIGHVNYEYYIANNCRIWCRCLEIPEIKLIFKNIIKTIVNLNPAYKSY